MRRQSNRSIKLHAICGGRTDATGRSRLLLYQSPERLPFFGVVKKTLETMANRSAKRDEPHGKDHEQPRLYAENTTAMRSQEKLSAIYIAKIRHRF